MALEVYWSSGSAPCWRVLLALAWKGAPYESRLVELRRRDHRSPAFLAMNPRGKVPVIRDGAFTLRESWAIVAYLDRRFPAPPLFGETPEEAGRIQCLVSEHEAYLWPPLLGVTRPLLHGGPGATATKEAEIRAAAAALRGELERLDRAMEGLDFAAGARPSAADLAYYPSLQLALRAAARPSAARFDLVLAPLEERYPRLATWCRRIEALPGHEATCPPRWRER
jgi:glutathione S-transferase